MCAVVPDMWFWSVLQAVETRGVLCVFSQGLERPFTFDSSGLQCSETIPDGFAALVCIVFFGGAVSMSGISNGIIGLIPFSDPNNRILRQLRVFYLSFFHKGSKGELVNMLSTLSDWLARSEVIIKVLFTSKHRFANFQPLLVVRFWSTGPLLIYFSAVGNILNFWPPLRWIIM